MRFWRRQEKIEGRSLESWLQPSDRVVDRIVSRIEPARRSSFRLGYRQALAAALTVVALGVFGAFGGISYAAKAVKQAVDVAQPSKHDESASARPNSVSQSPRGLIVARSSSSDQYGGKTTICHKTGSAKNPWVLITVSNNSLPAHKAQGDTLPAPDGSCPGPPIP